MLLKLIPPNAEPTIHFTIAFSDLPAHLPTPLAWSTQFNHLLLEELELPTTMLSFDKAAGLVTLIDEVQFDLAERKVSCRFIDGAVEQWSMGLDGDERSPLEEVISFVQESTMEDEREKERVREREKERQAAVLLQQQQHKPVIEKSRLSRFGSSSSLIKATKHKKQRSLFMQIVSCVGSIINLSSPSTSSHPHSALPPFQDDDSTHSLLPTSTNQRARALRRAARSSLMDTFRRFVLPVLTKRGIYSNQHGGFCLWILLSMKQRCSIRIEQILDAAGFATQPEDEASEYLEEATTHDTALEPTTMDVPSSFSDAESETIPEDVEPQTPDEEDDNAGIDEDDDLETETDGSSLHTPSTFSHQHGGFPSTTSSKSKTRPHLSPETYRSASALSVRTTSSVSSSTRVGTSHNGGNDTSSSTPSSLQEPSLPPSPIPGSPSPPPVPPKRTLSALLAPELLNEHRHLAALCKRIDQLVSFRETQARVIAEEQNARMEMLAVRSKRRAWSNGVRLPGSGRIAECGFAVPFRSSPLARYGSFLPLPPSGQEGEEDEDEMMLEMEDDCVMLSSMSFGDEEDDTLDAATLASSTSSLAGDNDRLFRPSQPVPHHPSYHDGSPSSLSPSGRRRKHRRSWQQEEELNNAASSPSFPPCAQGTSRYDASSLPLPKRVAATHPSVIRRRRISAASGTIPLSKLFPVSEELEREMEMENGFDPADEMMFEEVDMMGTVNRRMSNMSLRTRGQQTLSSASGSAHSGQDVWPYGKTSSGGARVPGHVDDDDAFDHFNGPHYRDEEYLFDDMEDQYEDGEDDQAGAAYPYPLSPSPSPPLYADSLGREPPSPTLVARREAFELERPQVTPRVRTKTARMRVSFGFRRFGRSSNEPAAAAPSRPSGPSPSLGDSSILYQPCNPTQPKVMTPGQPLEVSRLRANPPSPPRSLLRKKSRPVMPPPAPIPIPLPASDRLSSDGSSSSTTTSPTSPTHSYTSTHGKSPTPDVPSPSLTPSPPPSPSPPSSPPSNMPHFPEDISTDEGEEFTLAMDVVSSKLSSSSRRRRKMFGQLQVPIPAMAMGGGGMMKRKPSVDQIFSGVAVGCKGVTTGQGTSFEDQLHGLNAVFVAQQQQQQQQQ